MSREPLYRLAARQHALFTRGQAAGAGVSAKVVEGGVRSGAWVRVYRGVYRVAGAPISDLQALHAAVLAGGPRALASHRGAAWLWGLADTMWLELTGPQRPPGPGVIVHRRPTGGGRPVTRRGVPCTDPLRTVLDLAGLGDEALVGAALDRGVASGLCTVAAVAAELDRQARRGLRGVALLRECLSTRLRGTGRRPSDLELAMDRVVLRHGLPLPAREYRLPGTRCRLDYAWPGARLAVEVDGYEPHSGLEAFCSDRRRQNVVVLAGWTVLRFTWSDVLGRPGHVAGQIRAALGVDRAC
ncbi:MAG: type IV toxin-antitoxin system AbiEi family antitoxin domain-containing protein [Actinomycetota bacterium]